MNWLCCEWPVGTLNARSCVYFCAHSACPVCTCLVCLVSLLLVGQVMRLSASFRGVTGFAEFLCSGMVTPLWN